MKGTLHSRKLQHNWNFTIRLFRVISRTLVAGLGSAVCIFYSPGWLAKKKRENITYSGPFHPCRSLSENKWKLKRNKFLTLAREVKNECDGDINCDWCSCNGRKRLGKETERVGNRRTNWDYPDYNIVKNGLNNDKSPEDLWRLAVYHSPEKD